MNAPAHERKFIRAGGNRGIAQRGRPRTRQPDEPRRFDYRDGKKQVSAFVTIEKWRALRNVATKTDRKQTDLINEALDDLAVKYGEQPEQPKIRQATTKRRGRSPS